MNYKNLFLKHFYDMNQSAVIIRDENSQDEINLFMKDIEKVIYDESRITHIPLIENIIHYIIKAGGKRIRPYLSVLSAKLFSNLSHEIALTGAAIEFIHTATLLHDDVVDNGEKRRGKNTAHLVWGNETVILVGDHLFAQAFRILVKVKNFDVLETISRAAQMLAEGEVLQLSLKNKMPTKEDYFSIITSKTASLFSASCKSGAILSGTHQENCELMEKFGLNFGLIFQIIDDILDYESNFDTLGKKVGDDFFEGKYTLPVILAYEKLDSANKEKLTAIMQKSYNRQDEDFNWMLSILNDTGSLQDSREHAKAYYIENQQILSSFGDANSSIMTIFDEISSKAFSRLK